MDIKVLGYLIGNAENENSPTPSRKETVVELHMPRERLMYGAMIDYEQVYGKPSIDKFSEQCCPSTVPAMPQRFGRVSSQSEIGGGGQQVVSINIVQVENVVDDRVGEILIFREFLNQVAGNVLGGGNLDFATTNRFKPGSESLYFNGMLLYPGLDKDYIVWDGTEPGKPAYNGISFMDLRPPPLGVGNDPQFQPPRTAEEQGHIEGENDGLGDDIILISYIKA